MSRIVRKNRCILFSHLGDFPAAVPAMRALQEGRHAEELHRLVTEEAVPIVQHWPWVTRVWGSTRPPGRAQLRRRLPYGALPESVYIVNRNGRGNLPRLLARVSRRVSKIVPLLNQTTDFRESIAVGHGARMKTSKMILRQDGSRWGKLEVRTMSLCDEVSTKLFPPTHPTHP